MMAQAPRAIAPHEQSEYASESLWNKPKNERKCPMTTATSWRIRGDAIEACSCDIICSCNFGGSPSPGLCEAIIGYQVQEGHHGDTQLNGLNFVLFLQMPGKVFDGNWTLGVYLDQRASEEQAGALGTILSGQAGGMFADLGGLIGTALPPKQVPISFDTVDGEHRISVPGLLEVGSERIPNPVPGAPPLDAKTSNLALPIFTGTVSVRRTSVFQLTDSALSWDHPGQSVNTGQFDYSGP